MGLAVKEGLQGRREWLGLKQESLCVARAHKRMNDGELAGVVTASSGCYGASSLQRQCMIK